jgi:hypothetical protein
LDSIKGRELFDQLRGYLSPSIWLNFHGLVSALVVLIALIETITNHPSNGAPAHIGLWPPLMRFIETRQRISGHTTYVGALCTSCTVT